MFSCFAPLINSHQSLSATTQVRAWIRCSSACPYSIPSEALRANASITRKKIGITLHLVCRLKEKQTQTASNGRMGSDRHGCEKLLSKWSWCSSRPEDLVTSEACFHWWRFISKESPSRRHYRSQLLNTWKSTKLKVKKLLHSAEAVKPRSIRVYTTACWICRSGLWCIMGVMAVRKNHTSFHD